MRTLIVVDVQPGFNQPSGNTCPWGSLVTDELIANCEREVLAAKANGDAVVTITVDYFSINDEWFGPTDGRLMQHLKNYKLHRQTGKMSWGDGACNVLAELNRAGIKSNDFRVIGVRTNGCVKAMVEGLRKELPDANITVVKDACNEWDRFINWSEFDAIPGVRLDEGAASKAA